MTKFFITPREVLIGSEVPANIEVGSDCYLQTDKTERLMEVIGNHPELVSELKLLLSLTWERAFRGGLKDGQDCERASQEARRRESW